MLIYEHVEDCLPHLVSMNGSDYFVSYQFHTEDSCPVGRDTRPNYAIAKHEFRGKALY
jgi:hypothetical protein